MDAHPLPVSARFRRILGCHDGIGRHYRGGVRFSAYFEYRRRLPDRVIILDEWIARVIREPIRESVQADGRIRRWGLGPKLGNHVQRE